MNRTFLLFLMIGTAMMIAVIGQHEPAVQLETMPWDVDHLENNSIRVFGITLEKTSIQESNQILANFGKTQLEVNINAELKSHLELSSTYQDLVIGGLNAQLKIVYQLDQDDLQVIYDSINATTNNSTPQQIGIQLYPLSREVEMNYLNTPVSKIIYTPSIDFDMDTLRQNFGLATEETTMNDSTQVWHYPDMGLKIYIHNNEADRFIYASPNQTPDEQ